MIKLCCSQELAAFLWQSCPVGPLNPPIASPADRIPLTQVPVLSEENPPTWAAHVGLIRCRAHWPGPPEIVLTAKLASGQRWMLTSVV